MSKYSYIMKLIIPVIVATALITFSLKLFAQDQPSLNQVPEKIKPQEINVASSAIFDFMGVSPSQISKTSDIKDLKVDWSFNSWKLNPNLAIQGQPVWEMFYNRKDLSRYRQASYVMRTLASTDFSVGTVQNESNDRRIGGAVKINLFKKYDALRDVGFYKDIEDRYKEEFYQLSVQMDNAKSSYDTLTDPLQKMLARQKLTVLETTAMQLLQMQKSEIIERGRLYAIEKWNNSFFDVAGGKIMTYVTDSVGLLKSLKLNRQSGWGLWANGGVGVGNKLLFSGLFRTFFYDEQLTFTLRDLSTGEEIQENTIVSTRLYTYGVNIRYGNPIVNFFAEFFLEKREFKDVQSAFESSDLSLDENIELEASTLKWTGVSPYIWAIGGEWRASRNLMINFGMKMEYDKDFKRTTFQPIAAISCLMR